MMDMEAGSIGEPGGEDGRGQRRPRLPAGDGSARPKRATRRRPSLPIIRLLIIDDRALIRDSIAAALAARATEIAVTTADLKLDLDLQHDHSLSYDVAIVHMERADLDHGLAGSFVRKLLTDFPSLAVIVMPDSIEVRFVLDGVQQGVRGFITTDLELDVMIEVVHLVAAGGVYVPPHALTCFGTMR